MGQPHAVPALLRAPFQPDTWWVGGRLPSASLRASPHRRWRLKRWDAGPTEPSFRVGLQRTPLHPGGPACSAHPQ